MTFIPINEKTPEEDDSVLVVHETAHPQPIEAYYSDGYFYEFASHFSFPLLVTHWMPLPKFKDGK